MWTKSACVVLAWSILLIVLVTVCRQGSIRQTQANIRIASSGQVTLTSTLRGVATPVRATSPTRKYVVQQGDTLSGIAAQLRVRGGWPALYAANRPLIGPDPNIINPGTVLVLPGHEGPVSYTVADGDTLSGIAAALAVRGGWPALYAANRPIIGPDPDAIRAGTVLTVPVPAAPPTSKPTPPTSRPAPPKSRPAPPTSRPTPHQHPALPSHPRPTRKTAPAGVGMPQWLKLMLLVAGLIVALVFLAELALVARRQHQLRVRAARLGTVSSRLEPAGGPLPANGARIVMADYHRVIVTCSQRDETIVVLRPPDEDPKTILGVARLVLPEAYYAELASRLGMPASWPIVMADYDRVVVTCSKQDDTVFVLRPPGEDPKAVLRAARLVLPEGPYGELADQLGEPAGWPME
ncbi:MAG: LysM domain-containing protein [Streptosporangiaceae bacterium]